MKVYKKELNSMVMSEINKYDKYRFNKRTLLDGIIVMNSITRMLRNTIMKGNIISFGFMWLYPHKKFRFKKRNIRRRINNYLQKKYNE